MKQEQAISIANDLSKGSDTQLTKAAMFAAILLVVHLLDIKPSEVETLGLKVTLSDPSILRGGLALIFFQRLYDGFLNQFFSDAIMPVSPRKIYLRFVVRLSRKRGRSVKNSKRIARFRLVLHDVALAPYACWLATLFLTAGYLGIVDIGDLANYVWYHGGEAWWDGLAN